LICLEQLGKSAGGMPAREASPILATRMERMMVATAYLGRIF